MRLGNPLRSSDMSVLFSFGKYLIVIKESDESLSRELFIMEAMLLCSRMTKSSLLFSSSINSVTYGGAFFFNH